MKLEIIISIVTCLWLRPIFLLYVAKDLGVKNFWKKANVASLSVQKKLKSGGIKDVLAVYASITYLVLAS